MRSDTTHKKKIISDSDIPSTHSVSGSHARLQSHKTREREKKMERTDGEQRERPFQVSRTSAATQDMHPSLVRGRHGCRPAVSFLFLHVRGIPFFSLVPGFLDNCFP